MAKWTMFLTVKEQEQHWKMNSVKELDDCICWKVC